MIEDKDPKFKFIKENGVDFVMDRIKNATKENSSLISLLLRNLLYSKWIINIDDDEVLNEFSNSNCDDLMLMMKSSNESVSLVSTVAITNITALSGIYWIKIRQWKVRVFSEEQFDF